MVFGSTAWAETSHRQTVVDDQEEPQLHHQPHSPYSYSTGGRSPSHWPQSSFSQPTAGSIQYYSKSAQMPSPSYDISGAYEAPRRVPSLPRGAAKKRVQEKRETVDPDALW